MHEFFYFGRSVSVLHGKIKTKIGNISYTAFLFAFQPHKDAVPGFLPESKKVLCKNQ